MRSSFNPINEKHSKVKIAIAGPGRSGTTFLVQFLQQLGFTVPPGKIHKDCKAGLESRIGANSPYEVDKDPWCYEYIDRISAETLRGYDAFIVLLRNLEDASLSRSVQERFFRATNVPGDNWRWNSSGQVAGGAVSDTSQEGIRNVLLNGLWKLIECLAQAGVQPRILQFPKLASDFDYLWSQTGDIISSKTGYDVAKAAFINLSKTSGSQPTSLPERGTISTSQRELEGLVEMLRQELATMRTESEASLRMMQSSWSWRLTSPFRLADSILRGLGCGLAFPDRRIAGRESGKRNQ
jgi:hypothetical protein